MRTKRHYPDRLRRIRYRDPQSDKTLVFITNRTGLDALTVCGKTTNGGVHRPPVGTAGDDTLAGGAGADTFVFDPEDGSGNDTITDFTQGEDLIDLSAFSTISGFSDLTFTSDDEGVTLDLTALGGGNDMLIGAAGDDSISGGGGSDRLLGRAGDDTLDGGSGGDSYWGGEGADRFVVGPDNSENILWDFRDGEDVIDLTAFTGISGFSFPITVAASSGSRPSRAPTSIPNRRRVRHRGGRSPPSSCPAQHGRASRGVEARSLGRMSSHQN